MCLMTSAPSLGRTCVKTMSRTSGITPAAALVRARVTATLLVEETRRRLGPVGTWLFPPELGQLPIGVEREQVARIDRLGYGSLWTGQSPANPSHREIVAQLAIWLAATERTLVGSGIVNVMGRHPTITQAAAATLAEAYPGRLVLGLGAGHRFQAEALGETYDRPVERMRDYLDRMDAAAAAAARPGAFPRVLAALHPRMLALARERADGAHPFLVPVAHTAAARQALGPDKLLVTQQAVLLDDDPGRARGTARSLFTLGSIYGQNLRRFGFDDADFADGASDRLIDAVIAWGDERAIAERVREHLEAGADHVLVHPLNPDLRVGADWLDRLAPVLLARRRPGGR